MIHSAGYGGHSNAVNQSSSSQSDYSSHRGGDNNSHSNNAGQFDGLPPNFLQALLLFLKGGDGGFGGQGQGGGHGGNAAIPVLVIFP